MNKWTELEELCVGSDWFPYLLATLFGVIVIVGICYMIRKRKEITADFLNITKTD